MKVLYVSHYLSEVATTRLKARELVSIALKDKAEAISLKDIQFASRSFLHELLHLTARNDLDVIDYNKDVAKLVNVIQASSKENVIAPILEIKRAAPLKI